MSHHPSLAAESPVDVLRLIRTPNVGPVTFFNLVGYYGSAAAALEKLPELARRGGRRQPLVAPSRAEAEREIEATETFGARLILYGAPDYPALLAAAPDAPPVISVLGSAALWQAKEPLALVGARNASAAGCQFAQRLGAELSAAGFAVVSGLARGIDAFAHKGALSAGTVGVIAGGIDNVYPPENQMLFAQLRDMGAIISEQPFGQAPFAGSFPGRNRIIAGMSLGTVVVEASLKSGSLITAKLAADYGREVFAVPGSPLDPRSKGGNQLIRDGAHMVESAADIIGALRGMRRTALQESPAPAFAAQAPNAPGEQELANARALLLEKLGVMPVMVDTLIEQCAVPAQVLLPLLFELELAGRLVRSPGNRVALIADMGEGAA